MKYKIALGILAIVVICGVLASRTPSSPLNTSAECLQGREAAITAGGIIDPMNSPPKAGCPYYEQYTKGQTGTYQLGPHLFRIPRDYLWQGKYKEGEVQGLYFYIEYPSLKPAIEQFGEPGIHDELNVSIEANEKCVPPKCNKGMNWYNALIKGKGRENTTDTPIDIPELGLKRFNHVSGASGPSPTYAEVYYTGDPHTPNIWYYCRETDASPNCQTKYLWKDDLWIRVMFSHQYLLQHEDIRAKLDEILSSFLVESQKLEQE